MKIVMSHPWHVLFFAIYPVLFLYSVNFAQVSPATIVPPLLLSVTAAFLVTVITWLFVRDLRRAGLVASIAMFTTFAYGHVYHQLRGARLGDFVWGRHRILISVWLLGAAGSAVLALRIRKRMLDVTRIMNVVSAGLVAISLVVVANSGLRSSGVSAREDSTLISGGFELDPQPEVKKRDIYYIILDRYAGDQVLRSRYKFDNRPFLESLRERGFYVPDGWANYPRTTHSLASSLNMGYLNRLAASVGEEQSSWAPLFRQLRGHEVAKALKSIGYKYVTVGSWWRHTSEDPMADVNFKADVPSQFSRVLYQTTLVSALGQTVAPSLDLRHQYWDATRAQFDQIESVRSLSGPRFVFAHLLLPHDPFVFKKDGTFLTRSELEARPASASYIDQVQYANDRVLQMVESLTSGPEDSHPIIILQSDEGMFPLRFGKLRSKYRWDKADGYELRVKMNILSSYYWPGLDETGLYPTITPVNTFRLLFRRYFGAELPLLPDRIWVYEDNRHPFRLHDVTELLKPFRVGLREST